MCDTEIDLLSGDLVIAEGGFTGKNMAIADVNPPPPPPPPPSFHKMVTELEKTEVDWSRGFFALRIYVERESVLY